MAVNKEILIQTADKGESLHLDHFNIYEKFEQELMFQHPPVTDIFDTNRIKVKTDGSKYIFNIDGENKFTIGNADIERRMRQFCEKNETRKEQEDVLIRIKGLKIEYIKSTTQAELSALKSDIDKLKTSEVKETDIENVKYKVERLITFFEQERELTKDEKSGGIFNTKYDRKDKGLRNIQKTEINRRLKELNKIKGQIERLESNQGKTYDIERDGEEIKDVKMGDVNNFDMKITLKQLGERVQQLGKEAPDFVFTRNNIILEKEDTTPYYEYIVNNVKDATKLKLALNRINNDYVTLNKMSLTVAKRQALQQDLLALSEYLNKYINNPNTFDPTKEPFIPKSGSAFAEFCKLDPELKNFAKLNQRAGHPSKGEANPAYPGATTGTGVEGTTGVGGGKLVENVNAGEVADPSYTDYQDAIEKNGIKGALRHTFDYFPNMKSEQKTFRTNTAYLAGMGFALYKLGKRLFFSKRKLDKDGNKIGLNFLGKMGILLGVGLGSNMLTGKSPFELIDKAVNGGFKFKDMKLAFGKKSNEASPDAQTSVVNPLLATRLLGNKKISELPALIDIKTFKLNDYNGLMASADKDNKELLNMIGSDDKNGILLNGLAQLGITPDNLADLDQSKTIDDYYTMYLGNITTRNAYCLKNKLAVVSGKEAEEKKLLTSGKTITDADLDALKAAGVYEAYPAVIDTTDAISDKAALDTQIDGLTGLTTDKATLKTEVRAFYDRMPKNGVGKKEVKITQALGKVYLETYAEKAEIDLDKRTLAGFSDNTTKEYVFTSDNDLLATANLTNYIKKLCKDKEATTATPFHISRPGGDIEFASASALKFDTEIVTAGTGGSFENVSVTLEKNKQAYCDYLNTLRFRKSGSEISSTTEKITFNKDTKTLAIGDKKFKVTAKENIGGQRVDKDIDIEEKTFTDMDAAKKKSLQGLTAVGIGTEGTVTTKTKDGKNIQITIERTA